MEQASFESLLGQLVHDVRVVLHRVVLATSYEARTGIVPRSTNRRIRRDVDAINELLNAALQEVRGGES